MLIPRCDIFYDLLKNIHLATRHVSTSMFLASVFLGALFGRGLFLACLDHPEFRSFHQGAFALRALATNPRLHLRG